MDIARSAFYYHKKENMVKEEKKIFLKNKIQGIAHHHSYYAYRRITAQLHKENIIVNHKRALHLMREPSIQGRVKRRYATTTNNKHNSPIYPNLIRDKVVTGTNQIWCSGITYIRILSCFFYLAAIIDIYSQIIVGYALGRTLQPKLTLEALKMVIVTGNTENPIHHCDQGVQHASADHTNLLKEHDIRINMAAKGSPYDNTQVESFFKMLKQEEEVYLWQYEP